MIQLNLGDEPIELTDVRAERLPKAIKALNAHGPNHNEFKDILDRGYQVARDQLRERQHGKCAFCEKSEDAFKRPVEHFRPKKGAEDLINGKWIFVNTHYWWLTWTWTNLYFTCDECNRSGHKGSRFPIEPGTSRVQMPPSPVQDPIPSQFYDLESERNLLIDPRCDDPFDHLEWTPIDRTKPPLQWSWTVTGRDSRGSMTIDVLGLMEREDEVNRHLKAITLIWNQIAGHLIAFRLTEAQQCWDDLVTTYVDDPKQPFRAAAWWALDSLCDQTTQRDHGFRCPLKPMVTQKKK